MPESYGTHGDGFGLTFNVHFLLEGLCAVAFLKSAGFETAWLGLGDQKTLGLEPEVAADAAADAEPDTTLPVAAAIAVIVVFFAWLRFGYPKIQKRGSFP